MNENENELFGIENYDIPEQREIVVDTEGTKVVNEKDLSPIERIQLTAKEHGFRIKDLVVKDGRVETGCRRKGCWGRGYYAWDGNVPLPCKCIFHKEDEDNTKNPLNRRTVRAFDKVSRAESSAKIQEQAKVYGLVKTYRKYDKEAGRIRLLGETASGVKFEWTNNKGKWDFRRYVPGAVTVAPDEEA